ncbi:MAG: DUF899 family protein [Alphaproteobacteria bacterium]|nr:DUF899 family protein [Alphaproteobacteria bacterium]
MARYRLQIAEVRGKMRELQQSIEREEVRDYEFSTTGGEVCLSELFGDKDYLFVVDNMGAGCRNCTLWADGRNGILPHIEKRATFVVASPDAPAAQQKFKAERGWLSEWCRIAIRPSPKTWATAATKSGCPACRCSANAV